MHLIINFKTYKYGKSVLKLAKDIEKINKNTIIGVQPTDIKELSEKTKLKVYSQHIDPIYPDRNTGFISAESIKYSGASGTFLNHSEHPLDFKTLKKTIQRCKELKLKTIVFFPDIKSMSKIQNLKPDYLIYEPPELVAGNTSVSSSKPEIIKKIASKSKIPFLVGAGIKSKEDIQASIKFGAKGVAISSVITKSKNPKKVLRKLLN